MMSLLDCICCNKHGYRTAVVSDDLGSRSPCFLTYSELMLRAQVVAKVLSHHQGLISSPHAPVATYGRACPEILVAILGILASPLYNQLCVGVAYLPVYPCSSKDEWKRLLECGVEIVVIEISVMQAFITSCKTWSSCHLIAMDTSNLLHLGLVVARVSWVVIKKPLKVTLELPPAVMAEYAKDCDQTCYACVCLHDPHSHKSDLINRTANWDASGHSEHSDLINRTAERDASGHSEHPDLMLSDSSGHSIHPDLFNGMLSDSSVHSEHSDLINRTAERDDSGHSEHPGLINRTLNDSSIHSKHPDLINRTAYSVSSEQSTIVGCVCDDLVNKIPFNFFPKRDEEWSEKCSYHMTCVTGGDKIGSVCAFHPASHDLIINNRTAGNSLEHMGSCKWFPCHLLSPDEVAVVLSTSGTTGDPISVRVPHCSILPNILDLRSRFNITADDVVFNASPLTFDPSIVEIFLTLSSGSRLLMVPETTKQSPSDLASVLFRRQYVSFLQITPSLLFRFPGDVIKGKLLGRASHVRVLALGGEQCPTVKQLAEWKHTEVSLKGETVDQYRLRHVMGWTVFEMSNTTAVYNLYGITEVSSWATCHRISFPLPSSSLSSSSSANEHSLVPLGQPLLGTTVEVRDADTNSKVTQGRGIIWLGGQYRVCLIGSETTHPSASMRCSGDYASVNNEEGVVCTGRGDRQIKRQGHRINLDTIQQSILSNLDEMSSCVLHSISKSSTHLQTHPFPHDEPMLIGFGTPACGRGMKWEESNDWGNGHMLRKLRRVLPSSWVPDRLILVSQLPITPHGKVDVTALLRKHNATRVTSRSHALLKPHLHATPTKTWTTSLLTSAILSQTGQSSWDLVLNTRLTDAGLDSFDIVRLANQITAELVGIFGVSTPPMPNMVEKMLDGNIDEVASYMASLLTSASLVTSEACSSERTCKRPSLMAPELARAHKLAKHGSDSRVASCGRDVPPAKHVMHCRDHVTSTLVESWRRGQYFINGSLQSEGVTLGKKASSLVSSSHLSKVCSILWKFNTGKCVDASPLLVRRIKSHEVCGTRKINFLCSLGDSQEAEKIKTTRAASHEEVVVYVGSHSHLFVAVELATGREVWRAELEDRVESSACVSVCGDFIAVGCYDGCLYVLRSFSGEMHWKFRPPSDGELMPLKSSPCVDVITGWVWFGSHDHHLYAVDICERRLVHKLYPGGGSIFSTPCLDHCRRVVYCATLSGRVAACNADNGVFIWSHSVSTMPIFSSLTLLPDGDRVIFGCVDGSLFSLRSENGELLFKAQTGKSIFSSCCVSRCSNCIDPKSKVLIICGSHDKNLYCWNENLEQEWRTNLGCEVYSVPFCHRVILGGDVETWCVSVTTTCGMLYTLDASSGEVLQKLRLPGQVFSSPVCVDGCIVIGCRDNYVYCLDLCAD